MLVVFKSTHLYNHQNHMMRGGTSPKRPFVCVCVCVCVCVSCHFPHFKSISSPHHSQTYIFFTHTSLFHFFSLQPHPPLIQKGGGGGGACPTCLFIFHWDMPTSGTKGGGGGHVPEMPPLDSPMYINGNQPRSHNSCSSMHVQGNNTAALHQSVLSFICLLIQSFLFVLIPIIGLYQI